MNATKRVSRRPTPTHLLNRPAASPMMGDDRCSSYMRSSTREATLGMASPVSRPAPNALPGRHILSVPDSEPVTTLSFPSGALSILQTTSELLSYSSSASLRAAHHSLA